ncbi:MAG: serine hydrolase [Bryobacteraceae bacterium]|nr:serine hydrolase [Bryobacteraceae bacterium]
MFRNVILVLTAVLAAFGASVPPSDTDAWVARAMKEFDVPGVALAVIKDGKPVLVRGYGVRKLGDSAAVDANTLFGIASNSKAFTATALAILVDEGKISWDDPVQKHLPTFATWDPWVSREVTIRDLLCHRIGLGLGAGDLLFWPDTDVTREQVVSATRWIRPTTSFRSKYAYNNLAFVVAGEVVRAVSGKPWDQFVRERIFTPVGMSGSQITTLGFRPGDNVAAPHSRGWRLEGALTPIPATKDDTWAAAAGVKSNLLDLTKWVSAHLNQGKVDGKQVWSEKAEYEMQSPQTIINIPREGPAALRPLRANFSAYGLGFSLRDYKGRKIVSHGGALTGMLTTIYMIPQENLGIVVLTNQEEGGLMSSVVWHIVDHYLDQPSTDWIGAFKTSRTEMLKRANDAEKKLDVGRAKASKPSLPLSGFAGTWSDAWYGKATLAVDGSRLVLRMARTPAMVADLEQWQHNTFRAVFRDKTVPDAFVTFGLDAKGKPVEMKMEAVSSLADFSFDYGDLLFRPEPAAK